MLGLAMGLMMLATASATICGHLKGNCHVLISIPIIILLFAFPRRVKCGGGEVWGRGLWKTCIVGYLERVYQWRVTRATRVVCEGEDILAFKPRKWKDGKGTLWAERVVNESKLNTKKIRKTEKKFLLEIWLQHRDGINLYAASVTYLGQTVVSYKPIYHV